MNYEKLDISDEKEKRTADILKNVCIYGADENNRIFKSIKNELKEALLTLLGEGVNFISDRETEFGLILKLTGEEKLGKEGYRIFSSENSFTVEAKEYNGLLYGVF